jgi:anti-sigma factor (TIGR02949 family)
MSLRRTKRAQRKMNCMQVGRALQSYLDDEIDDFTARRIAAHLEDCRRCGMEADAYTELKRALNRRADRIDHAPMDRLRDFSRRLADGDIPPEVDAENPVGA